MQIGFPNNPGKPLLREIEWIGKNGFDFFEMFLEPPMASPEKLNPEKISEILDKYKMKPVGHLPWYFPIGSPEQSERKHAIDDILIGLEFMQKIGIEKVTIHANWHPILSEKRSIEIQSSTLNEISRHAKPMGIMPMLELMDTPKDSEKNICAILDNAPGIGLNLDIGHANLSGRNPSRFIEKFHSRICHVHMHDNDGITDMHLPIGQGIIDWKSVVETLKKYYDGTITLEIFHGGRDFILLSRKRLLRYWNSP